METTSTCWKEVGGGARKNGFIGYKDILRHFGGSKIKKSSCKDL